MLTLDGSTLEGGGQLTRMALCLSALTGIHLRIHSIRAGRGTRSFRAPHEQDKQRSGQNTRRGDRKDRGAPVAAVSDAKAGGGLKESHLAALYWLAEHCQADVDGDRVGSREVVFRPARNLKRKQVDQLPVVNAITLQKPGSLWLIFQAIFPFIIFKQFELVGSDTLDTATPVYDITLQGGTNVPKSMASEYVQQVFLPVCTKIGLPRTEIDVSKRGWTTGKIEIGQVRVKVYPPQSQSLSNQNNEPSKVSPLVLPAFNITSRGHIISIAITLLTSSSATNSKLTNLITTTLLHDPIFQALTPQPTITVHPSSSTDSGDPRRLYILLVAHTSNNWVLGRDYLGPGSLAKNTRQEDLMLEKAAGTVVRDLMLEIAGGGCVDEFMADQLVVFQALAKGLSVVDSGSKVDEEDARVKDREVRSDDKGEGDQMGSLHARTVRWVCEEILGRYGVRFESGGRCHGIGWNDEDCKVREAEEMISGIEIIEEGQEEN